MEYRKLGRSGLKVSELCLGTMTFGWTCDEKAAGEVMEAFVAAGGNFIDTADIYSGWAEGSHNGQSEEIIGRWVKQKGNRKDLVLATKVCGRMWEGPDGAGLSHKHIVRACEESLRRLQVDYIDLYQFHGVDKETPVEESLRAMDSLVRAGKVLHIGTSNFPAWRLMQALWSSEKNGLAGFVSYQPDYSILKRYGFEMEHAPLCQQYGLGVIPYSPLARGFLTGKYRRNGAPVSSVRAEDSKEYFNEQGWAVIDTLETIGNSHGKTIAQTALAWLLGKPVMTAPIVGANAVGQLNDLLGVVGYRLSDEEMVRLDEVSKYPREWWRPKPD
jgi:aryl-alcohol dehydrogenase-like predicted oxidoreductase